MNHFYNFTPKYAIIGGGISGLSIANLLKRNHEVTVFEADTRPGGMIKCDVIEAICFIALAVMYLTRSDRM